MRMLSFVLAGLFLFGLAGCYEEVAVLDPGPVPARVAVLTAEGFHDGETLFPLGYLKTRGAEVSVIGIDREEVKAYNSDVTVFIEKTVYEVSAAEFDAVVIPGGRAPAVLRENERVLEFVRESHEAGKILACICHGPQVMASAGILDGKAATCVSGISEELEEAGALYRDEQLVRDGNIITSRVPADIPAFSRAIGDALFE